MSSRMRAHLSPQLVAVVLAALLVLGLGWVVLRDQEGVSDVDATGRSGSRASLDGFGITGSSTSPIRPGLSAPLDLDLTNSGDAAITISSLSVTVRQVLAPNADATHPCSVDDFSVRQAPDNLDLTLDAGQSSSLAELEVPPSLWPRVRMLDRPVNQDGCQQSTLTLDYSGSARREE